MRNDLYTQFNQDGYLVVEDFFSQEEVDRLKEAGINLAENVPEEEKKYVFTTTKLEQSKEKYFIESGDKIRYFYEEGALNDEGKLVVPRGVSLNKVGHNLHWLHPDFKKVSFGDKVQQLCKELRLESPMILQSMYIYKNPGIGGEVVPHQDATFLFTEPNALIGLWFPLDDATLENGCLWFIPGSHTNDVHRRYLRKKKDGSDDVELIFDRPPVTYPVSSFIPCPVKKGSCVVIHGNVVHKSDQNKSDKSRHAYTFHIMDATSKYSPDNWLQSDKGFPLVYPSD